MTPSGTPPGSGPDTSFDQRLLTFRLIGGSLGLGVTLFALVSWFLHLQSGSAAAAPDLDPALMFSIMLATAVAALGAAVVWWRARVAPLIDGPAAGPAADRADLADRVAEVQTNVIIAWALAELPALFAVVLYYLYGDVTAGVLGVVIIWTAVALTWPRRSWFEAAPRY